MFQWMRDVYPSLPEELKPIEFLQESGDIAYLPAWWGHGTFSVGDTLGFFKVPTSKLSRRKVNGEFVLPSNLVGVHETMLLSWSRGSSIHHQLQIHGLHNALWQAFEILACLRFYFTVVGAGPNPIGPLYDLIEPIYDHRSKWADRSRLHPKLTTTKP